MRPDKPRFVRFLSALLVLCAASVSPAHAQESLAGKKLRLVVPFSPGGSVDGLARALAEGLQKTSGATVTVENRPGAGGNIAANQVARSYAPGGDSINLLVSSVNHYVNPVLVKNSGYDAFRDFAPVAQLATMPYVFVVPPASNIGTLGDFVARARAEPGKLSWGFGGNGTLGHFLGIALEDATRVKGNPVSYRGGPDLLTALGGNHVDMVVMTVQSAAPLIRQGRLKALAVATPQRNRALPQVPAVTEQIPDYPPINGYAFLLAPSQLPEALLTALQRETNRVLRSDGFAQRLEGDGATLQSFNSPAEARTWFDRDGAAWENLTRKAGLKVE